MKTAGQILKNTRVAKDLEIKDAAKATKIRPSYIKALEADDYLVLPSLTSTQGFLKNYAEFLGLRAEDVLAVFRRDFDEKKVKKSGFLESFGLASKPQFTWTPKWTTIAVVALLGLLFLAYLVWQYFSLVRAPYY